MRRASDRDLAIDAWAAVHRTGRDGVARAWNVGYASPGVGAPSHLATELLADAAGIKLTHVPYNGAAQALQGVARGRVGSDSTTMSPSSTVKRPGIVR
jgi:tripartite-type tricarboxylate transporter receptor subunit TctC